MDKVCQKLQKSILMSTFGSGHGKFIHYPAGKHWCDEYDSNCVGSIGIDAADLNKTTIYMNENFSTPSSKNSKICDRNSKTFLLFISSFNAWSYMSRRVGILAHHVGLVNP